VSGANDHSSLSINNGGLALSPAMCVGIGEPTARVFFKQTGGLPGATLQIDVLFDDASGTTQAQTIGCWASRSSGGSAAAADDGEPAADARRRPTAVAFRFTAIGGSVPDRRPVRRSLAQARSTKPLWDGDRRAAFGPPVSA
jgi:hypothetical protein